MGTIVKVCGINRAEDARASVDAGADWLGFVLKGDSPRRIDPERARAITAAVDGTTTVAVMVSPTPDEALAAATRAGTQRVQLHRVDAYAWPRGFPLPCAFAVPVAEDGALTEPLPPESDLVLLDASDARRAGGTGRTFPWETARVVAATRPLLLAGGLDASNVEEALMRVRPFGVDACSRLETQPGVKDAGRLHAFVAAVRRFDERATGR